MPTRINSYTQRTKEELVEFIGQLREPLRVFTATLPDDAELSLLDKDELIAQLVLFEGEMYSKHNEDKEEIKGVFDNLLGVDT